MTSPIGGFGYGFRRPRLRRPQPRPFYSIPKISVPRIAFVDQYGRNNTIVDRDANTITVGFQRNPGPGGTNTADVGREDFIFQDPRGNNTLRFNH